MTEEISAGNIPFLTNPHKFNSGRVVMTRGVAELIKLDEPTRLREAFELLRRHVRGDWGEVDPEDAARNEEDLIAGERLLSAYHLAGHKVWIITEWDRSLTTILFPSEY